uniref:Uncharacterized protein n=1 Tax=Panagrolaimus superbus TaxID=310955 RepID=A0A914Z7Z2_9BILA
MPVEEFVENIHVVFDQTFKAVIVNVFDITAETGFSNNVKFCEAIREKLKKLKILHYFVSDDNVTIASSLIIGNINAKLQESIFIVMAHETHYIIHDLCFTDAGYKLISHRYVQVDAKKESLENIKQKIYGSSTPENTVVISLDPNDPLFLCLKNNASKFKNLVAFDVSDIYLSVVLYVDEMYKWLMDKRYIKYHVLPASARTYFMVTKAVEDANRCRYVDRNEILPFKKYFILDRNCKNAYFTNLAAGTKIPKLLQEFSLTSKCHYYWFSVSIDAEHFPTVKMEPIIQPQIQRLPKLLDISNNPKVPVITFFYNISFICVPKNIGSKCYEFLDEWNGIYGKDLYISFDKEKPKFFEDAFEVYKTNPSFVVYDLLRIISMSPDNIDPNSD